MNRRRVLQSFLSFTAGCAVVQSQTAIGMLSASVPQADDSAQTLIALMQNAIQLCHDGHHVGLAANRREVVETRQLCHQAITRVQRSSEDTPAFWQACNDSVGRLEAAVSAHIEATHLETRSSSNTLCQLRNLKKHLAIRTVQAIGTPSWLA